MNDNKGLERSAQLDSDTRIEWVKPEVRRMAAGDAEAGFPGSRQDAAFVTTS